MISSMLIGRLGNSMFQIAQSIAYATKYGYNWAVQEVPHNNESAIHRIFPNLPKTNHKDNRYQEHPNRFCEQHGRHFDLCHFDYHDIPDVGPNVYFVGFWQSWKYFEHCKEEIKELFKLPHVEGYEDYVSIHVRRGDYVQHSGSFPPITMNYISKSMQYFLDRNQFQRFIIFSDDIQWCKDNITLHCYNPTDPETTQKIMDSMLEFDNLPTGQGYELQKLSLMASCGHHIIANSTFSWWASYLGHNPNRIVISPSAETWFGPSCGVKQPVKDLILPEWIQIPTR